MNRPKRPGRSQAAAAVVVLSLLCLARGAEAACAAPANAIEAENCLPGAGMDQWDVAPANLSENDAVGYTTDLSYNKGETVQFKIKTSAPTFTINIFRLGWYGGKGGRKVGSVGGNGVRQPACLTQGGTSKLIDCGNWSVNAEWAIPVDAISGVYMFKIISSQGKENLGHFIVRDDGRRSDILYCVVDTNWQAYNHYGGNSLYTSTSGGRGAKVSYNRPFEVRGVNNSNIFNHELAMIRWLEQNGYDMTYFTKVDMDRRPDEIKNHKIYLLVGHDEYTSPGQRAALEASRETGVHMVFVSGNTWGWKIRWENSIDGKNTPLKTMVCYKDRTTLPTRDPLSPPEWTGSWSISKPGTDIYPGKPPNAVTGTKTAVGPYQNQSGIITAADGKMRFWRNTSVAVMAPGQTASFPELLGYEWDEDTHNSSRQLAQWRVGETTVNFRSGPKTWSTVQYRHNSGALVWAAGTMQWPWHLDTMHSPGVKRPPTQDIEQATVNVLADMNAQPVTLKPNLQRAAASTDFIAPACAIVSGPSTAAPGQTVTVRGTAQDAGGGVVGGVLVSLNNGRNWRPAQGRENWSFTGSSSSGGRIFCRAVDDSGNLQGRTTPPGGGTEPPTGDNPVPVLSALEPQVVRPGRAAFTLSVRGSGFVPTSVVQWDGTPRPTNYVNSSLLRISVAAEEVASERVVMIRVVSPAPGGGNSSELQFIVSETASMGGPPKAYPNPWKASRPAHGQSISFNNLKPDSDVKIFTVAGHWVVTLKADAFGLASWPLRNDRGENVASGYYLYLATDVDDEQQRGKLAVIR